MTALPQVKLINILQEITMTDRNKFEEMLELLVNEDKAGAEELFHEIVVEKSREIYATMLESDIEEDEEVEEAADEEVEESEEDLDETTDEEVDESSEEEVDEGFDLDEFEVEADDDMDMNPMGGDMDDLDLDGMGDEGEGEEDLEAEVADLADELEALKAQFADMMNDNDGEEDEDDDESEEEPEEESFAFESDEEVEEATDEEVEEASEEEVEESVQKSSAEMMREYVNKIQGGELGSKIGGDNGANAKSPVAGKNDMGGTASNIVSGGESSTGGTQGGLENPTTKEHPVASKQTNKPGGNKATAMSSTKGHGAETKRSGDNGANAKPVIGG